MSGPNGVATTAVTLQDQRVHNYSPNAANQYTQVTHPGFFNVRGTRAAGAAIVVNGASIPASGYQPATAPTIFRAEVPNLTPPPAGTTNPDIYEPVRVTQSGVVLTVDDPIQYVPPPLETLTYDADGNLKTDGRWTCTWDAADRLVRMESTAFTQPASTTPPLLAVTVPARVIEFAYDGLSRRIRKKVTEGGSSIVLWEAYVYDGWNMVLSVKLNPAAGASQGRPQSAIASYVWGPDLGSKPFARRDWQAAGGVRGLILANYFTGANGGGLHAPGMDAMGNVTSVTRLGVASTYGGPYFRNEFVYDYDAFGKEMRSSTLVAGLNPDSFPFHYSTKFTDPESGFNYYGYRFYDPANGRWINRDPIGEKGGVNVYGMVGNDGVELVDYLGLQTGMIAEGAGETAAGIAVMEGSAAPAVTATAEETASVQRAYQIVENARKAKKAEEAAVEAKRIADIQKKAMDARKAADAAKEAAKNGSAPRPGPRWNPKCPGETPAKRLAKCNAIYWAEVAICDKLRWPAQRNSCWKSAQDSLNKCLRGL